MQILIYLITGLITIFSVLSFFIGIKLNLLPEYAKEQYLQIASARADEVSKELNGFLEQMQIISQSPVIKTMDFDLIKEYLPKMVLEGKHRNMTIANTKGQAWSTMDQHLSIIGQEQYEKIILNGEESLISQPFISEYAGATPITIISHAVRDDTGKLLGLVNVVIEIEFLNNIVEQMQFEHTGYGWIIGQNGVVVSHPDMSLPMSKNIADITSVDSQKVDKVLTADCGAFEYFNENGEKIIAVYHTIAGSPDWKLIISIPEDDFYAEVISVRNIILGAILIALVLAVFFLYKHSANISRPIIKLREVFKRAADGDLRVKADETVPNEIGQAAKSFNQMLEKIKSLTYKDIITGLYNYNGFTLEIPYKLDKLRHGEMAAIVIISLDDFKHINSISGYDGGNELLVDLSRKLKNFIGDGEIVARFFGDEFILMLRSESMSSLKDRVYHLRQRCNDVITIKDNNYKIKTSIGVSIVEKNESLGETIDQATIAKLKVKKLGGNSVQFYNMDIAAELKTEQKIENSLSDAIKNNELYLVYQPIIDTVYGKVIGAEALLRWRHKEFGEISPITIIEVAEKGGLILEIGNWVLQEACRQNKKWQEQGYVPAVISVNVSALQLEQANFVEMVRSVLIKEGLEAKYLELEITETHAMSGVDDKMEKMKLLKEMGVRIAIDDFGTGYSSLTYFAQFPIDTLKIDRSFISRMLIDENVETIVATMITMAKAIKVQITAEGVESQEQLEHLRVGGCDRAQGYLISKPVVAQIVEQYFRKI